MRTNSTLNWRINLRAATFADEPLLVRLHKFSMTVHLDRTEQPINEAARYRRVRYGFEDATIICDGTEGIGLIRLTRSKDGWYIHQIQMLPSHQGQGIGREVICAVLAEATQVGLPVSLSVLRDNPALRLYERLGFHVISKTEFEFDMTCHPQS